MWVGVELIRVNDDHKDFLAEEVEGAENPPSPCPINLTTKARRNKVREDFCITKLTPYYQSGR